MSKKVNESLSNSLGIEFIPETKPSSNAVTVVKSQSTDVTYTEVLPQEDKESEDDFQKSRESIENVLEKGSDAIETMMAIAEEDETPRSFEVVATLLKTVSEASKDLYSLHETRKKLRDLAGKKDQGGGFNIDKAVFVGSTKDVLQQMKKQALEQIE